MRTPYDYVEYESAIEKAVAQRLDEADNVRFFCKLPAWFKITTPIGDYNPDWAVVLEDEKKLYLIRETKSSHDSDDRRSRAARKILGIEHSVQPSPHWLFEGKSLKELYEETYGSPE